MPADFTPLLRHIPPLLLVFFRLGGLFLLAPVLGSMSLPARVRLLLAASLTLCVYPFVPVQVDMPMQWTALAPMVASELIIGLVIGYGATLPLIAIEMGGLMIGQQMGLAMARVVNPDFGSGSSVVGEMLFFLALAAFVIMDGHLLLVDTLVHSFHTVPLGGYVPDGELLFVITGMLSTMVNLAVKVAAPLLCMIFLETIAMGFIARTVPQLNILSLGFPLRILVGLGVVVLTLMAHYRAIEHALRESLSLLYSMF